MERKDRSRRMAIVLESGCWEGSGDEKEKTVFNLVLVCISGEDRGKEFDKRYSFRDDLPDYLKGDLLKMGYIVKSLEDLENIVAQLVGIILRVSLVQDGDTLRVYIDDYFGRDDPKKYVANG